MSFLLCKYRFDEVNFTRRCFHNVKIIILNMSVKQLKLRCDAGALTKLDPNPIFRKSRLLYYTICSFNITRRGSVA